MDSGAVQNNAQGSGEVRSLVLFDVVHDVVKDLAPEELSLLAGLSRFDEAEAGRRLARGAKRDDPLGFGMGEVVAMVTPVVWIAVQEPPSGPLFRRPTACPRVFVFRMSYPLATAVAD